MIRRLGVAGGRALLSRQGLVGAKACRPCAGNVGLRWFSEEKKPVSPAVSALVDQICALNLLEVSELVQELNERLDLPAMPSGGMMMPMGMPMAAPAAAAEEAAEEEVVQEVKKIVNIQLDSFDAAAKIKVIKEVKNLTNLGLKEAKAAVEGAPGVIMNDVKREDAENIIKALEEAGAKASMI